MLLEILNIHLRMLCAMSLTHKENVLSVFNVENVIMLGCKHMKP